MNTNLAAVVFASILVCGVVGVSVAPRSDSATATATPADESLGGDVSAFMQRGAAGANASVDAGMWLAAFETAENQSRKQTLVTQRTATLAERLDRLESRVERFSPPVTNRSVAVRARWVRLVADRNALEDSITTAKTTAAGEGVNATGLDRLDREVDDVTVPEPTTGTNRDATNATAAAADPPRGTTYRTIGATYGGP